MKKLIESMDHIEECGMAEGPMGMAPPAMAPEDKGNPVTVNVSMNASGKEHVADLLGMMKNAGLGGAEPVSAKTLSPRMDMERLAGIMDDPAIPGKDDVPGDADVDDSSCMDDIDTDVDEGAMSDIHAELSGADDPAQMVMDLIDKGGPIGKYLYGELEQIAAEKGQSLNNTDGGEFVDELLSDMGIEEEVETEDMSDEGTYTIKVKGKNMDSQDELARLAGMSGSSDTDVDEAGDYANEPDPQYGDMSDAIPDGNDLNRKKKSYPATQDGDNPMAVEAIKATLLKALAEKKMPMGAGPDGKKGTDDDKPAFLDQKKGDKKSKGGSKPKKGVVPPQFKKKGTDEGVATKDCPKCGAPGKKKLMACSSCGCS